MPVAFFDLDRTLISRNSATLWVRAELRGGFISRRTALRALAWVVRYQLGAADMEVPLRAAVSLVTGMREADIEARTRSFYARDVAHLYRPGGLEAIARHRARGDRLVLLTTSSSYLAAAVADHLRLDGFVCNRMEVDDDGRYTGRPIEPLCFGPGKVELARAYLRGLGAELSSCAFYSDSFSDVPMLDVVGEPAAINPDLRLRRLARRRGWPVLDWGEPAAPTAELIPPAPAR